MVPDVWRNISIPSGTRLSVQPVVSRIYDRFTMKQGAYPGYLCELAASADNLISSLAWVSNSFALPA